MKRLNFEKSPHCKGKIMDSEDVAILPSGSKIYRCETRKGRIFKLWLNDEEYERLQSEHGNNFRIHFYGQNYVYLNEYQKLAPLLDCLLNIDII